MKAGKKEMKNRTYLDVILVELYYFKLLNCECVSVCVCVCECMCVRTCTIPLINKLS